MPCHCARAVVQLDVCVIIISSHPIDCLLNYPQCTTCYDSLQCIAFIAKIIAIVVNIRHLDDSDIVPRRHDNGAMGGRVQSALMSPPEKKSDCRSSLLSYQRLRRCRTMAGTCQMSTAMDTRQHATSTQRRLVVQCRPIGAASFDPTCASIGRRTGHPPRSVQSTPRGKTIKNRYGAGSRWSVLDRSVDAYATNGRFSRCGLNYRGGIVAYFWRTTIVEGNRFVSLRSFVERCANRRNDVRRDAISESSVSVGHTRRREALVTPPLRRQHLY